ncbi:UNVERIFIED_CONTAM: hypothetical protein FKN15_067242 [Acipenser sinensis]
MGMSTPTGRLCLKGSGLGASWSASSYVEKPGSVSLSSSTKWTGAGSTEASGVEAVVWAMNDVAVYRLQAPEPRNRAEFLKYSCQLTLDPNTANIKLFLSEGNRKVTRRNETQPYPDHPERFDSKAQVLCRECLSGTRCYWEIEWNREWVSVGVTYKGISRKGGRS